MKDLFIGFALVLLATSVDAQQTPATSGRPALSLAPPPDAPPPINNPPGPFAVTVEADATLPTHTIYRPADLQRFGGDNTLPIVSWGNGACANAGMLFEVFLRQIASHGYLAISIGPKDAPLPSFAANRSEKSSQPARPPLPQSRDEQMVDAIDWAVKENERKDSAYYKRLNTDRIAVMGQSCGGLQAMFASSDPRVKTSVLWNSGVFTNNADSMAMRISKVRKEDLAKLHAPIAYFIGGPTDIAHANAEDDFKRIEHVPIFKANLNVGHGGTFRDAGAGWFGEVGVAWLDWQLKGSARAATYFEGIDCQLCKSEVWSVEKKRIK